MKLRFAGRKIELSEGLKSAAEKKVGKLRKFFNDETEAQVTFSVEKDRHTVEITIYQGGMIYRAEDTGNDMYATLDKVVDIIERQIRKNKTRLEKKLRENAFLKSAVELEIPDTASDEEREFKIVKSKKHAIKPMSPEEAILQMNLLGHEFYIFRNAKSEETNIVYKRNDGNYGLIEPEE